MIESKTLEKLAEILDGKVVYVGDEAILRFSGKDPVGHKCKRLIASDDVYDNPNVAYDLKQRLIADGWIITVTYSKIGHGAVARRGQADTVWTIDYPGAPTEIEALVNLFVAVNAKGDV